MQLRLEQLASHLEKQLQPLYVLHGDEPLLLLEAADAIRAKAKAQGFTERNVFSTDRSFDWSQLSAASGGMSLFGDKPMVDLRIPTGKPGKDGGKALVDFAARVDPESFTLISLPKLEREQLEATWFKALDEAGVTVQAHAIERAQLPLWIGTRLLKQKQSAKTEALQFMADRVEGNLLAAHQELQKLALLYPEGELSLEQVEDAVLNVARYDVFKLNESWLAGDTKRFRRMLDGLKGEGETPILVLWAMTDAIRNLGKLRQNQNVWFRGSQVEKERQKAIYERAAKSMKPGMIGRALQHAAKIDRLVKGLKGDQSSGDVWEECYALGTSLF